MSLLQYLLTLAVTLSFVHAHQFGWEPHQFPSSASSNSGFATSTQDAFKASTTTAAFGAETTSGSFSSTSASGDTESSGASTITTSAAAQNTGGFGGFGGSSSTSEAPGGFFGASTTSAASSQSTGSTSTGTGGGNASDLELDPNNVQTGSDSDGDASEEAGQSPSITDPANFINFCGTSGQQLTNGTQITEGSCNGVVMGQIPSKNNMISSIITFPTTGQTLQSNQPFNVSVQVQNLEAGTFTNPNTTYYSAPQTLKGGKIVGHTHVTIQSMDSLNTNTPPDPTTFAFFKGINDDGNGNGGLSAAVATGLPAGFYRVCTMTSASNHQPVLMPVSFSTSFAKP